MQGLKKVKKEEKKNETDQAEMNEMLKQMMENMGSEEDSVQEPVEESKEDKKEDKEEEVEVQVEAESDGEDYEFTEEMKVNIGGTDYYKKDAQGIKDCISSYPDEEPIGQLQEDGETIEPFEFEDEDDE